MAPMFLSNKCDLACLIEYYIVLSRISLSSQYIVGPPTAVSYSNQHQVYHIRGKLILLSMGRLSLWFTSRVGGHCSGCIPQRNAHHPRFGHIRTMVIFLGNAEIGSRLGHHWKCQDGAKFHIDKKHLHQLPRIPNPLP